LVYKVFKADPDNPLAIGGTAANENAQLQAGGEYSTNPSDAQPGDAIFFQDDNGNIVHTGIVVDVRDGNVYFVHAPHPGAKVRRWYIKIKQPNLGQEKFAGVGRPRERNSAGQPAQVFWIELAKCFIHGSHL